jgi:hypothetical protein
MSEPYLEEPRSPLWLAIESLDDRIEEVLDEIAELDERRAELDGQLKELLGQHRDLQRPRPPSWAKRQPSRDQYEDEPCKYCHRIDCECSEFDVSPGLGAQS